MSDVNYSIVGTVNIGTDEYRDLIEGKILAEKECDEYRSNVWKKSSELSEKDKEIERLSKIVADFKDFLNEHSAVKEDFSLFIHKKSTIEEEY